MKRRPSRVSAALVWGFAMLVPLAAETAEQNLKKETQWQKLLKDQIKHEKNCHPSEILTYNAMNIGDEIAISGKILCMGGQQYEYSRLRQHLKFEFRACEPNVC